MSACSGPGPGEVPPDFEVAIIGAGAAGLAAAAILRRAGRRCILLEAGARIGGRAHTARPAILGGVRFDTGATWLHQADRNPLATLARARGITLARAHQGARRLFVGARPATQAEAGAYDRAWNAWTERARSLAGGSDRALSEAGADADPWTASIENWEGAIIAAADADGLSLHDWHRNQLDDNDLSPPEGVGSLLAGLLGPMAGPVATGHRVDAVDCSDPDCCHVHGPRGRIRAGAVIVTVSTGVLRAGHIAFTPSLPASTLQAIDSLPMGLLNKLALPARGDARGGLEAGTLLEDRLERRGGDLMLLSAWPGGLPYVSGFFGGRLARRLAGQPQAALAQARALLRRLLGPEAEVIVPAEGGLVTDWAGDPLFEGAYAYCPPGHAGARGALAVPAFGRLLFAGEACRTDGLAGTVGGALLDGERAAQWLLRHRFGIESPPCLADGFTSRPIPV